MNLSGNTFYVRSEQDIRSLAVEIATLTRTQQRLMIGRESDIIKKSKPVNELFDIIGDGYH